MPGAEGLMLGTDWLNDNVSACTTVICAEASGLFPTWGSVCSGPLARSHIGEEGSESESLDENSMSGRSLSARRRTGVCLLTGWRHIR